MEDVPDWVLERVIASVPDDWRVSENGWINESEAVRRESRNFWCPRRQCRPHTFDTGDRAVFTGA
jgi:hypothetical protein